MNENSVITLFRRVQLCFITSGGIASLDPITQIAFGDGGVDAGGTVIPPTETQTALNNEIARFPIDSVTYPLTPTTTARYTCTLPINALAGAFISEAALVDAGGNLHAIKSFLAKGIDSGVAFTFEFDDEF